MIIRQAVAGDAPALVRLAALLGHDLDAGGVARRLAQTPLPTLVAVEREDIVGMCGLSSSVHIHRDAPVGRITIIAVDEAHRGRGIGRHLVDEAVKQLAEAGCGMVEVTSNDRLTDAHAFYQHLGFERTSSRFAKRLSPR